jgi:hypothetical protein
VFMAISPRTEDGDSETEKQATKTGHRPEQASKETPRFLPQRPGSGKNRRNRHKLRLAHPQPTARAIRNGGVPFGLKGRNALAVPIAPDGTKNPKGAVFPLKIDSRPDGDRTGSPECDSQKE